MYRAAEYEWQREVRRSWRRIVSLTRPVSRRRQRGPPTGSAGPTLRGDGSEITQIYKGTNQIQRVVMARQLLK